MQKKFILPLSNNFIASLTNGTSNRLTTKPGVSLQVIVVFPIDVPHSIHLLYVSADVSGVFTT